MSTDLYIMRVPVISTAHLPNHEAVGDAEVLSAVYEGGWFVYMEDEYSPDMPDWYRNAWCWAKQQGFSWIRFDADGDYVEKLEKFIW